MKFFRCVIFRQVWTSPNGATLTKQLKMIIIFDDIDVQIRNLS